MWHLLGRKRSDHGHYLKVSSTQGSALQFKRLQLFDSSVLLPTVDCFPLLTPCIVMSKKNYLKALMDSTRFKIDAYCIVSASDSECGICLSPAAKAKHNISQESGSPCFPKILSITITGSTTLWLLSVAGGAFFWSALALADRTSCGDGFGAGSCWNTMQYISTLQDHLKIISIQL